MRELLQRKEALRPRFSINVEKEKKTKNRGLSEGSGPERRIISCHLAPPTSRRGCSAPLWNLFIKTEKCVFCSSDETDQQHLTRGFFLFLFLFFCFVCFFLEKRDARERASVRFPSVAGRGTATTGRPGRYYCLSIFVARTRLGTTLPTRTVLAAAVTEEAGRGKKMNTK